MRRVLVIGSGGAGKSTLARALSERIGLEVVHLDVHFWNPGWVPTPDDEWLPILDGLMARDAWIMDGSFYKTLPQRIARADTVLFVDTPRWKCLVRAISRLIRYRGRNRPDLAEGCPERFDWPFLFWIWGYKKRTRPGVLETLARHKDTHRVEILRSNHAIRRLLASI